MKIQLSLYLLLLPAIALAGVYRWTDDQGNVVYSQTPPPDGRPVERMAPPPLPAEPPHAARKRLERIHKRLEESAKARQRRKREAAKTDADAARRQQNCRAARENLERLTNRPSNTLYRVGENDYRRLTPEERRQRIEKMRKIVKENCN